MTRIEKEMRKREADAIRAVNKTESDFHDIYEDALRALWSVVLVLVGMVLGFYMSETRARAAETVSIPPRAVYVGPITEQAPESLPEAVNEVPVATMPDAVMVERVGEPHERWESLGVWKCTAYDPFECCNGRGRAWKTASGAPMVIGETVATARLPFGTKLKVNGRIYIVTDRGTPYGTLDILHESHSAANRFGVQRAEVFILRR